MESDSSYTNDDSLSVLHLGRLLGGSNMGIVHLNVVVSDYHQSKTATPLRDVHPWLITHLCCKFQTSQSLFQMNL